MSGMTTLNNSFTNKGIAFNEQERVKLGVDGLLPTAVRSLEAQEKIVYSRFKEASTDLAK